MVAEFHAGIWSIKDAKTLVKDMHWNAKKLMYQATVSRRLARDIKTALKQLMNEKTSAQEKEGLKKELPDLLKKLEKFSILEEGEEFLVAREAAEVQKRALGHMKLHVRVEIKKLLGETAIPRSYKDAVLKKVGKDIKKIRKDTKKQAIIALEVTRGSASATLQSLKILALGEKAAARRQKRRAWKAEGEFDIIKEIESRLEEDERGHEIDKIKRDLIKEAHADEKEIHFIYINLLYCLLFMSYIEKRFEKLGDVMKKGEKHPDVKQFIQKLEKSLGRIKEEWHVYMTKLTQVLQQLRFSIAPVEEGQILARAA